MSNDNPHPFPARTLQNMKGFRRYGLAFLLGGLMTLSMPPVNAFPVLLASVPGFIWLARGCKTRRKSFLLGWAFGAGYFICGLYWISAALFVDIRMWGWVMPLSLIVGPAVLALYYGFIPLIAHRWRGKLSAYAYVTIAVWALVEWLRGHLFTGFPWNLPGYAWHHALPVMQVSSVIGVYGLTLLTLFWAALPVYWRHSRIAILSAVSFAAVFAFGCWQLLQHPTAQNDSHTLRIVQPNLPQNQKWDEQQEWENLKKHALLSGINSPASFVIWPETSVVTDLVRFPNIAGYISRNLPPGSIGVLGSLRVSKDGDGKDAYHNSISVLDRKGRVVDHFDKFHLVPFGEYIPFRDRLNLTPIAAAISNIGDFTAGDGNKTLRPVGYPSFSPLICYEAIFPHAVADPKDRPDWLVNVTNDGWYGKTSGPYQHLEITRMRAIEEGLPLARAANTGISAVIDPVGRIIAQQALATEGVIDSILPAPLPPTLYARFGDVFFFFLAGLLMVYGALRGKKM